MAVAQFTAMLAARANPVGWTDSSDVAVRIGERAMERGRPLPKQRPEADPVALVLIHPDTETVLTSTLHCPRDRIHGAWVTPYRLLTHAFAGYDLPPGIDLSH
ncbi:hypothetical protein [Streptomyces sp. NPDC048565]|uniref:hypothetical protein n=1 Tax=Streptomyces sp. NPDC048565 TaxID=3155266 RepID=UPI0034371961